MHRIVKIELFKPDPLTGTLGYVSHQWNRRNPWQVLGNFFIGIGPVLFGCAVLFATFYLLIPNSYQAWDSILVMVNEVNQSHSIQSYLTILIGSSFAMVKLIFTIPNLTNWQFWVFAYLSPCVASNIRLSPSDIKGSLSGFGCIVLPFLLINFLGLITGFGSEKFFPFTASSLGVISSLFVLALIMVLIGFALIYLVSAAYVRIKHGSLLNPF